MQYTLIRIFFLSLELKNFISKTIPKFFLHMTLRKNALRQNVKHFVEIASEPFHFDHVIPYISVCGTKSPLDEMATLKA